MIAISHSLLSSKFPLEMPTLEQSDTRNLLLVRALALLEQDILSYLALWPYNCL